MYFFPEPLRAGGPDVILVDYLKHGRARGTRDDRDAAHRGTQPGEYHAAEIGDIAHRRQQPPMYAQQQDEHHAQPELRHCREYEHYDAHHIVEEGILPESHGYAQDDTQYGYEQAGARTENERVPDADAYHERDILHRLIRGTHISLKQAGHIVQVLRHQRQVQAVLLPEHLQVSLRRVGAQDEERRVVGAQ